MVDMIPCAVSHIVGHSADSMATMVCLNKEVGYNTQS